MRRPAKATCPPRNAYCIGGEFRLVLRLPPGAASIVAFRHLLFAMYFGPSPGSALVQPIGLSQQPGLTASGHTLDLNRRANSSVAARYLVTRSP